MNTSESPLAVVVGSLNMDLVLEVARAPMAGETVFGRKLTFVPGGKGANQAVACARLGGTVAMIGRVGSDDFGGQLRRGLMADGVDVTHVSSETTTTTGTALILVEDSAQNRIAIVPGANGALQPADVDRAGELIAAARLMLLQLESPLHTVEHAIDRALATGNSSVILNPAPAQTLPERLWSRIDYIIPNETEASLLTGIDVVDASSAASAAFEMRRRGAKHVVITLGSQGVLIYDDQGTRTHPAPRVQAVDTTAAGDTFIGGLAAALLEGKDLDTAAKFAIEAAALSVTRVGAQSSIPYRQQVMQRM